MTLEEVVFCFKTWRANKRHAKEVIPEDLWGKAKSLYPQYSRGKICKTLGLNSTLFNQRFSHQEESKAKSSFLAVSLPIQTQSAIETIYCEISLKGERRCLTVKVPESHLSQLLAVMGAYL